MVRACNEPLIIPAYAEDGGEEGEIAGIFDWSKRAAISGRNGAGQ